MKETIFTHGAAAVRVLGSARGAAYWICDSEDAQAGLYRAHNDGAAECVETNARGALLCPTEPPIWAHETRLIVGGTAVLDTSPAAIRALAVDGV